MNQSYGRLVSRAAIAATAMASLLLLIKIFAWWYTGSVSILAALVDSLVDIGASLTNLLVVRRTQSQAVRADMLHYQSDVMMNGAILLALGLSWYGWHRADALFALGIGIYILYSALRMGYEAVQSLLDRALPDEERQEIIDIVTSWPGVSGAHDLRTRQSGPTRFIQIHLEMEDSLPLVQAHMVADQVEQAILRRFPGSDVIIHQDPCSVVPREGKRSMLS